MKVQSTKDPKQIKKTIKICIIALCVLVASGSGYLGFKIYQQILILIILQQLPTLLRFLKMEKPIISMVVLLGNM